MIQLLYLAFHDLNEMMRRHVHKQDTPQTIVPLLFCVF
jgi:hypothetical protein